MRNGTVMQRLRYMADAQIQLFKDLLRQRGHCSRWGSCGDRGQWEKEKDLAFSGNEEGSWATC